ncbi:hypothetical protein, partial [Heyndrickxia sporothermodurans]|uniref:hypothetical protein n=1 Tax=Heyndrickxia sporothermodurans TaxID=46224 RepID=UPI0036CB3B04
NLSLGGYFHQYFPEAKIENFTYKNRAAAKNGQIPLSFLEKSKQNSHVIEILSLILVKKDESSDE